MTKITKTWSSHNIEIFKYIEPDNCSLRGFYSVKQLFSLTSNIINDVCICNSYQNIMIHNYSHKFKEKMRGKEKPRDTTAIPISELHLTSLHSARLYSSGGDLG